VRHERLTRILTSPYSALARLQKVKAALPAARKHVGSTVAGLLNFEAAAELGLDVQSFSIDLVPGVWLQSSAL